jgi:hypothetical protein
MLQGLAGSAQPRCASSCQTSEAVLNSGMLVSCRNVHRGTAQSFALDNKALQWSQHVRVSTVAAAVRHAVRCSCLLNAESLFGHVACVSSCALGHLQAALQVALCERCTFHLSCRILPSAVLIRDYAQPAFSQSTRAGCMCAERDWDFVQ